MNDKQIVTSMLLGCGLIALGLIPGLISRIREGIQNLSAELQGLPTFSSHHEDSVPGQVWFAIAGFALFMCGLATILAR